MKVINRATIVYKSSGQPERKLALMQVEKSVFHWAEDPSGTLWDGVDYLTGHDAIKALRVFVECDPGMVGADLTIFPAALDPEERAALRIVNEASCIFEEAPGLERERIADIIREETGIDKMIESINLLITYEFPRRLHPKQPGLDMTWGGLCLSVIEALEIATNTDLSNLKKQLTEGIETVKVFSTMPTGPVN